MKNIFLFFATSFISFSAGAACRIQLNMESNWDEGAVQMFVLKGTVEDELNTQFIKGAELTKFQSDAKKKLSNVDPFYLIRRQMQIYEKAGQKKKVFQNVLDRPSLVGPLGCLEGTLFTFFGQRLGRPLFEAYAEVGAYLLQSGSSSDYRIYIQINPETAMLPRSEKVEELMRKDLQKGYRLRTHLHNHPFNAGGPGLDIAGTTIPSGEGTSAGDFSAYAYMSDEFDLEEARITNGFNTLRIKVRQLPELLK